MRPADGTGAPADITPAIDFDLRPAPWPSSRETLDLAVEMLPAIADGLVADLVEHLALLLVERDEQVAAVRAALSAALNQAHQVLTENGRLRQRVADLCAERRDTKLATSKSTSPQVCAVRARSERLRAEHDGREAQANPK